MYNHYFNFSFSPFENTLDQRFLFLSESHAEVIASLLYFVQEKKGFALVCGDVGTGKTMILHHVLSRLPRSVQPILIPYPDVGYLEILRYIARVLGISPGEKGILDLTDEVKAVLTNAGLNRKQFVLIIDEAHLLSIGNLEYIRLLSNVEITENKLLQILLIGQNELSHKLSRKEMRQLRERINVNRFLSPMGRTETIEYIDHRLGVAGSSFDRCFESACKSLICKMTGGVPRSINRLCDTALLVCMSEKGDKVTRRVLKKAHDALHSDVILAPKETKPAGSFSIRKLKPALAGGALVLLLALGFLGYRGNPGEILRSWVDGPVPPRAVNTYVQKPLPPVPEVKREGSPKPQVDEEKTASSSMPGLATPQAGPAQGPPEDLPKEDAMKIDKSSPSVEEPGLSPATSLESPAKNRTPSTNGVSAQSEPGDAEREIAAKGGSSNSSAQDLRPAKMALTPSDFFKVTVKKGESLSRIAAQWFGEDTAYGEKSILSANPWIHNKNRILAGQILRIPKSGETRSEKQ
jgi:general secretion pathway protein A